MVSKRSAQLCVLAFFAVLLPSIVVIINGNLHPRTMRLLAIGEPLPPVALPNTAGSTVYLNKLHDQQLLLISAPAPITPAQQECIARLSDTLSQSSPLCVALVTRGIDPTTPPASLYPDASMILLDEGIALRSVVSSFTKTSICLIDQQGVLRMRSIITDDTDPKALMDQLALNSRLHSPAVVADAGTNIQ